MPKVLLSDAVCRKAAKKLEELLEADPAKGILVQHKAAESLVRACQTQERYGLKQQTPADYERATGVLGSEAQRLEQMTPEEVAKLQRQMLGKDLPGKAV